MVGPASLVITGVIKRGLIGIERESQSVPFFICAFLFIFALLLNRVRVPDDVHRVLLSQVIPFVPR